jgi:hypothetical protein
VSLDNFKPSLLFREMSAIPRVDDIEKTKAGKWYGAHEPLQDAELQSRQSVSLGFGSITPFEGSRLLVRSNALTIRLETIARTVTHACTYLV